MSRTTVTVRVPASTSNCGAGFDTLGLALALHNRVTLTAAAGSAARPEGEREADRRASEMVVETAEAFFAAAGLRPEGFRYRIDGDVPPARGLGSSVTVIAGVLAGLDALHGTGFTRHRLVEIATALEGHPDNASAGVLGGFCVARCDPGSGAYLDCVRLEIPGDLAFVVVSPELEMLTKEARGVLPAMLPYFDAVRSINSASFLVAAMATGDYARLRHAGGDFMHEPYRLPRIPGGREAIAAGCGAGAWVGWLSGSGSSVLCVAARPEAGRVAASMAGAFSSLGVASTTRILAADNEGLRVD